MTDVFLRVLQISISASVLVGVIFLIRQISKEKVPRSMIYILWTLVGIRLLVPFSLESNYSITSLIPFYNYTNQGLENDMNYSYDFSETDNKGEFSGFDDFSSDDCSEDKIYSFMEQSEITNDAIMENSQSKVPGIVLKPDFSFDEFSNYSSESLLSNEAIISNDISDKSENTLKRETNSIFNVLTCVWLFGAFIFIIYGVLRYFLLKKAVSIFVTTEDQIRVCEAIDSPFVLGIIKPKIYLPFGVSEDNKKYIISHEKAHITRFDHISKILSYVALSVYWFNPFVWVWFIMLNKDMECACDEKVIKNYTKSERQKYALALLEFSIKKSMISACPIAFGEIGVKERVKNTMSYKKPLFWIIVLFVIIAIVLSVLFLTDSKDDKIGDISDSLSKEESEISNDFSHDESDYDSETISNEEPTSEGDDYSSMISEDKTSESSENFSNEISETFTDASSDIISNNESTIISKDISEFFSSEDFEESDTPSEDSSQEQSTETSDDIKNDSGIDGDINWEYNNGVLTISGNGDMPNYSSDRNVPWSIYPIKEVVIKEGVTSIGDGSFKNLIELEKVSISDTVSYLGKNAFFECSSLKSVKIPDGVSSISQSAFLGCSKLENVQLHDGLLFIENCAFYRCYSLKTINLPDGLISLEGDAFSLSGIETILIPEKLTSIGADPFFYCDKLYEIKVDKNNTAFTSIDGVLYDKFSIIKYPSAKKETTYTLPDGIVYMRNYAFQNCKNLDSVDLGGIHEIGKNAFEGCENLRYVKLKDYLQVIEIGAFNGCKSIKQISYGRSRIDWLKIKKENNWFTEEKCIIQCNDGNIEVDLDLEPLNMWLPFEDEEGFDFFKLSYSYDGTIEGLVNRLSELGPIPKGTKVLSFNIEGMFARIDLSKEFVSTIQGTTEEMNVIYSLVNTIIENHSVTNVMFTVEGKPFDSGHETYDNPLTFKRLLKLLLIDPETMSLYKTTTYFDGKTESIIDILIMNGTLPEETKILDFHTKGNYTSIDLSKEFGDVYFGDSIKGQLMLDSIIYTLGSYYNTYGVIVTIEGQTLDYVIPG